MTTEVPELLARTLQHLRDVMARRDPHHDLAFAHADGVIAALETIHALDAGQVRVWRERVAEIHGAAKARRSPQRKTVTQPPIVVSRVIAGPVNPEAFLDGWMRVVAVELFDSGVRVHWNLSPLPSYEAVLGDELAQLDRDTDGLPEAERDHARQSARSTRLFNLKRFALADDVETSYRFRKGHGSERWDYSEQTGTADFTPAAPETATKLVLRAVQTRIAIPLNDRPKS